MFFKLEPAKVSWQNNAPFSGEFQDIYFSPAGGIDETREVFLAGNNLPQAWLDKSQFTIAETGFGTGLNFLVTLQQWLATASSGCQLNYVAIEKFPLLRDDLVCALSAWPQLQSLADELIANYPACVAGFHRLWLADHRVCLTLVFDDALAALAALYPVKVDAWYLDGFAPSRNPQMWSDDLFQGMAQLSQPGTTFSTFTAAGVVRRGLQAHGFYVEKKPGFAGKRERLQGHFVAPMKQKKMKAPWFHFDANAAPKARDAIVIGGGISGASVAYQLSQRGWQVRLLERGDQLAAGASGNLAGVVMPRLSARMDVGGAFFLTAFLHTVRWLDKLKAQSDGQLPWYKSGVTAFFEASKAKKLLEWQFPPSVLTALDSQHGLIDRPGELGLHFPQAGYLAPAELIEYLAQTAGNLQIDTQCNVNDIEYADGQWHVHCADGRHYRAAHLVLANSLDAQRLLPEAKLYLIKMRGQLSYLPATQALDVSRPVCADSYVIPAYRNQYCIGATYAKDDDDATIRHQDHLENLAALSTLLPHQAQLQDVIGGRVSWRAITLDNLPLIGPMPDFSYYQQHYPDIKHGKPDHKFPLALYHPGLWLVAGMGSRGLVSAPFAAELLADMMEGRVRCVSNSMLNMLHPARLFVRKLRRSEI